MPDRPTPVPSLTDRAALDRNRARALRLGPVDFLHRIAADEIEVVNTSAAAAPGGLFSRLRNAFAGK